MVTPRLATDWRNRTLLCGPLRPVPWFTGIYREVHRDAGRVSAVIPVLVTLSMLALAAIGG